MSITYQERINHRKKEDSIREFINSSPIFKKQEIARQAGISPSRLTALLNGESLSIKHVEAIYDVLCYYGLEGEPDTIHYVKYHIFDSHPPKPDRYLCRLVKKKPIAGLNKPIHRVLHWDEHFFGVPQGYKVEAWSKFKK